MSSFPLPTPLPRSSPSLSLSVHVTKLNMMVMEKILLFHLLSLALLGAVVEATWSDDRLIKISQLKMFVDELPDMPKILGFDVVNGVPVSKSLQIGMFSKKWVRFTFLFFSFVLGFLLLSNFFKC